MKTARQRVFDFILIHQQVTAAEISKSLVMTQANARHHLEILISQGLVQVVGYRKLNQKGRPSILYAPSSFSSGENFDLLADALLATLDITAERSEAEYLYRKIAEQMIKKIRETPGISFHKSPDTHITTRLYNAIQVLNNWRYHARWEAHSEAPHVILGNCPYLSILPSHPELCKIDRELIEQLVEIPTQLLASRIPDERGLLYCRFRLLHPERGD